jgi:prolyl 3-hydroxylase /prolyl 3,4-dihydroxylase
MRPDPRIAALKGWVQEQHLQEKQLARYARQFAKAKPFPHLVIKDFLQEKQLKFLKKALEKQIFEEKESDLFSFKQTGDLRRSTAFVFSSLHTMLNSNYFLKWIQGMTDIPKLKNVVDLHGLCFEQTDYLLPHDDKLDDRKFAYIIYLDTLTKKEGGALEFFEADGQRPTKVAKSYPATANTFVIFEVSRQSFHQVTEVQADKQRFTLGGWFHG